MEREDVPARARQMGERLATALSSLDGVTAVRGLGLLLAVELDVDAIGCDSAVIARRLLDDGVVVNAVTPTALRLAPSLLITEEEADLAVTSVARALEGAGR
jgi:acetylornithine/succinyldiaminopimelate/putrescine aminotransferase